MGKPLWYIKLTHFEYWPTWLLYLPSAFYFFYLAIKSRALSYFTIVNPKIYLGGFHGESKAEIFNVLPASAIPNWFLVPSGMSLADVTFQISKHTISYPFIFKPDVGSRGRGVYKIDDAEMLKDLLAQQSTDYIIQAFVPYETELAVLYYKYPDQSQSGITSIAIKEFMQVIGDGQQSILSLMENEDRFRFQIDSIKSKIGEGIHRVPNRDERILLEPIGNHCRGTKFLNGNYLIQPSLVRIFDDIMQNVEGIYFCRFDLRVKDFESLKAGKDIFILELNGVGSDPAHIYDPKMRWYKAMKAIHENMKIVFDISRMLHHQGVAYPPFSMVYKEGKKHIF